MEMLHYDNQQLMLEAVSLAAITRETGTPVYVYSLNYLLGQLARLNKAFARLQPDWHYSMKANANAHLVRPLVAAGCGCDVVSAGEIFLALRAGCPAARIVFAGVGKTVVDIRYALEQRIGWFNAENIAELDRIDQLAGEIGTRARVALRLNPDLQAATHQHIATGHHGAKFGISLAEARQVLANTAAYPHLDLAGLHVHIGSQLGRPDETVKAAQTVLALAQEFGLQHINLGGGFPVAYDGQEVPPVEAFAAVLEPVLVGQGVEVAFEPGRFLVGEAGLLVAEVQYVKDDGRIVVLDAGMTDLLRPALYSARHPLYPVQGAMRLGQTETRPVQVVGPICESSDVVHPAAELPALMPGTLVAIGVAGAYGMTMASNYNARPRPAEVLVDGDQWRVIRRRETFADLARLEMV